MNRPQPRESLHHTADDLVELCEDYMRQLEEDGRPRGDMDHHIFERAMEFVYGDDVWDWVNDQST